MDVGSTKHRVGACPTNVRAGSKQGDVARVGVTTAHGEAVIDRLQANRMTMHATVDARIHFRGPVLSRVVSHDVISVEDAEAPYSGGRKRHANYRSSRRLKSRRINVNPRRLRGTRATRALSSAAADLREPAQTFRAQAKLFFPIESSSCGACHSLKPYGQPPVTPLRKSLEKLFHRARPVL